MAQFNFTFHGQKTDAPQFSFSEDGSQSTLTGFEFLDGYMELIPQPSKLNPELHEFLVRKMLGESNDELTTAMGASAYWFTEQLFQDAHDSLQVDTSGFMLACMQMGVLIRRKRGNPSRFPTASDHRLVLDRLILGDSNKKIMADLSISSKEIGNRLSAVARNAHFGYGHTRRPLLAAGYLMTRE